MRNDKKLYTLITVFYDSIRHPLFQRKCDELDFNG